MIEALRLAVDKHKLLEEKMSDPDIASDITQVVAISKELSSLEPLKKLGDEYLHYETMLAESEEILADEEDDEMREMAQLDYDEAKDNMARLDEEITVALLPTDPNDEKNIFLEMRPGAGGDESGLFAAELMRAYLRYADVQGWKSEIIENDMNDIGGVKLVIIKISGDSIYSKMKFESGVHRVQRIPETESNGRVHTSTVTVAIMPEVEELDVELDPNDVVMDTFGASSAGGQNANKNQNGVRLHHNPTGIIVTISDTKSQLQNKERAYTILKTKLYQIEKDKQQAESREIRTDQIGSGDRSEKIRTYNFPQDRVTDHRIKQSWSNLPGILEGDMGHITEALFVANQTKLLDIQQGGGILG